MSSEEEKNCLKCACCCRCWKEFIDMVNFNGKHNVGINLLKASSYAVLIGIIFIFIYWIFERLCCPRKKEVYRDPTGGADFEGHTHKMASIEVAEVDGELQENAEIAKEDAHFGGKKAHAKAVFGGASTNTFTFNKTEESSESESSEDEKKSKKKKKKKKDKKKKKKKDKKKKKKKKKKKRSSSDSDEDSS